MIYIYIYSSYYFLHWQWCLWCLWICFYRLNTSWHTMLLCNFWNIDAINLKTIFRSNPSVKWPWFPAVKWPKNYLQRSRCMIALQPTRSDFGKPWKGDEELKTFSLNQNDLPQDLNIISSYPMFSWGLDLRVLSIPFRMQPLSVCSMKDGNEAVVSRLRGPFELHIINSLHLLNTVPPQQNMYEHGTSIFLGGDSELGNQEGEIRHFSEGDTNESKLPSST